MFASAEDTCFAPLVPDDVVGLEVGYRLVPLVDGKQENELFPRIKAMRSELSCELGFEVPGVYVRDSPDLEPNAYRILLGEATAGQGSIYPDHELAIDPGRVFGAELEGSPGIDPLTGHRAVWIEPRLRPLAQAWGYAVLGIDELISGHLYRVLRHYVPLILGYDQCLELVERAAAALPAPLADLLHVRVPNPLIYAVVRNVLSTGMRIHDYRPVAETLAEKSVESQDVGTLTTYVRLALVCPGSLQAIDSIKKISVVAMAPRLERLLQNVFRDAEPAGLRSLPRGGQGVIEAVFARVEKRGVEALLAPRSLQGHLGDRASRRGIRVLVYEDVAMPFHLEVIETMDRDIAPA